MTKVNPLYGQGSPTDQAQPAKPAAPQTQNPSAQPEIPPAVPMHSLSIGDWNAQFYEQTVDHSIIRLVGRPGLPAELEDDHLLFRADEMDYDQDTGDITAKGHVFYHNFDRNVRIWCSRLEYNTDDEKGKFYDVTGESHPHIIAKPGVLTTNNPFHFEGRWAERIGEKYVLHQGFITNCKMPKPWWRLRGKRFDIVPGEKATGRNSKFILRTIPILYLPFFYHSLEREPRKSGFLLPMPGNSSLRGFELTGGYFWAINRSYDLTYRFQYYPSRGLVSHVDFRGKPFAGTDYDVILFGANDKGVPGSGNPPVKYSGLSILAVGKSDLGGGWTAHAAVNYITSFRFRQEWSESYSEITGSEIHSVGFVNKNWSTYTINAIFARLENFQSSEIPYTPPNSNSTQYLTNAVIIRKLPEVEFTGRDRPIFGSLPIWFSFETASGLLYRSYPVFNGNTLVNTFQTSQVMNRSSLAPHVTGSFHFWDIHLIPSFGIEETYYGEAQAPYQNYFTTVGTNIVRSSRDFSLDIVLPSLARVFQKKTIFGDKLKHVIEPRATYRYVTGIGTDYARFIRFDETDIKSNTNELLLGLTNRIYAKRGDSVQEIFTWELFQKRYFDPTFGGAIVTGERNLFAATADLTAFAFLVGPRSTSPVVSILRMSPLRGLNVQWQADYDHHQHGIIDSSVSVEYRYSKFFVSAGQNQVHTNPILTAIANQFHFRGGFGDYNRRGLSAGFEAIYDYTQGVLQYTTSQVTYNTDCCGFSVQLHTFNVGARVETIPRFAFTIANIATPFGNLKKSDRLF
ncbi:MAG TPA: LPS assembly protein LptD [Candidatus Acidoferrales bacterium]|nr:LPS assembly protein LptD [Candidatus Acidoferrales bacterium]